jgi:hypothetical protein
MGKADYYAEGDYNASCAECGRKFKASTLKRHWKGYYVCPDHWEPRHPQEFVRGVPDNQTPPWTQPPADTFIYMSSFNARTAIAGVGVAGCAIAGYVSPNFDLLNGA